MTSVRLSPARSSAASAARAAPRGNPRILKGPQLDAFERKPAQANLQRGMTGPAVTSLQQKLVAARFMSVADFRSGPGVYGPRTEQAVRRLQVAAGLPETGVAGPRTLTALASGARFEPEVADIERTMPISRALVHKHLGESFTDEVTQPIAAPIID